MVLPDFLLRMVIFGKSCDFKKGRRNYYLPFIQSESLVKTIGADVAYRAEENIFIDNSKATDSDNAGYLQS